MSFLFKEKGTGVIVGLILVMLFMNISMHAKIRDLENQVRNVQSNVQHIPSQVSHQLNHITHAVNSIKEEARWWQPGGEEVYRVYKGNMDFKISWYLKEYQEGSEVSLHYQLPGSENVIVVNAKQESQGLFSAILPVEIALAPNIHINWHRTKAGRNTSSNVVEREVTEEIYMKEKMSSQNDNTLTYYILIQHGDTIRTSEVRSVYLSRYSHTFFSPLQVSVNIRENNEVNIFLNVDGRYQTDQRNDLPYYEVESAYVETRDSQRKVLERYPFELMHFESENNNPTMRDNTTTFEAKLGEVDTNTVYLIIQYSDDLIIERPISL